MSRTTVASRGTARVNVPMPAPAVVSTLTGAWRAATLDVGGLQLTDLTGNSRNALFGGNGGSPTTNDPAYLWTGGPSVWLPGISGNYVSVPDEAALDITGDIDISVDVALADWTPSATSFLLDNFDANAGYVLYVNAAGTLTLGWGTGSALVTATSTAATGLTDGTRHTIRATLDVDNGAAGRDVKFYVDDVQLGATVTVGATTVIAASAVALFLGANSTAGGNPATGHFFGAVVKNGIGGTTVLDVDLTRKDLIGQTGGTAVTGQTVTLVRATSGRKLVRVDRPAMAHGTDDFRSVPHNAAFDVDAATDLTVAGTIRLWGTPAADQAIAAKRANVGTSAATVGWSVHVNTSRQLVVRAADGTDIASATSAALTAGALVGWAAILNRTTGLLTIRVGETDVSVDASAVGSLVNAVDVTFAAAGAANFLAGEVYGDGVGIGSVLTASQTTRLHAELAPA